MAKSVLLDRALLHMSPQDCGDYFEGLCCSLLERRGFTIFERPFQGQDQGLDMVVGETVTSLTRATWQRRWGVQVKFASSRAVTPKQIESGLFAVRQRRELFGLLLLTSSTVGPSLGKAVSRSAVELERSRDLDPPLVVWDGGMLDQLLSLYPDILSPIRLLAEAGRSVQHVALIADLPEDAMNLVCRQLAVSAHGSPQHAVCLQCSASEQRVAREQLVSLLAGRGLRPFTLDHEEGLASEVNGEYRPTWPRLIAGRCEMSCTSLTVVSQNTSSFVKALREPMSFLRDGELRLATLVDRAVKAAELRDLWCSYRVDDLRDISNEKKIPVAEMILALHRSHDLSIAWNGKQWIACDHEQELTAALATVFGS